VYPCEWDLDYSATDCALPPDAGEGDRARRAALEDMAVGFLWAWTGKNLGLCTETVTPVPEPCSCYRDSTFWGRGPRNGQYRVTARPRLTSGAWLPSPCGRHLAVNEVALPGPVHDVVDVTINGQSTPVSIRVDNRRYLVRTDGQAWPTDGSLTVTYRRGVPVPAGGRVAAAVFVCEMEKALNKDRDCALPERIQSITRQGVTVGVAIDTFEDVERGRTGIWLIDSWVASITQPPAPSLVHSPDTGRKGGAEHRVVTWQPTSP